MRATIKKEHVIMYCNGRDEQEIVVNPRMLKNVVVFRPATVEKTSMDPLETGQ